METAVRALKLGAFDFVSKPLDLPNLRKLVATAIKLSDPSDGSDTSVFGPRLLGSSPAMQHLREMIARVARSQAPVHIYGESGTGKELVAKLIHESGPRRDGPFVPGELRRDPDGAHGERAVRTQARQLHRRGQRQEGADSGGRRRNAVSRRDRRSALAHAGQAPAGDPGEGRAPHRRAGRSEHRHSRPVGHSQESRRSWLPRASSARICSIA